MSVIEVPTTNLPARMCQGRWYWTGSEYDERGKMELYIPERNIHPELVIEARIHTDMINQRGTWEVKDNGILVAIGEITSADLEWRDGDGPQLEAERVICYGASLLDTLRVKAYLTSRALPA